MTTVPAEEREFVRDELAFLADRLIRKHGLTLAQAKRYILEMISCSI